MNRSTAKLPRVLVVSTARATRGGIASVVRAMEQDILWKKFSCRWIETQIDRNVLMKVLYLVRSYLQFLAFLPLYDLVHFHTVPGNSTLNHLPLLYLARIFGKKTIVHLHIGDQLHGYTNNKAFRTLLSRADLLITISEMAKKVLKNSYRISFPVEVLYNACPEVKHNIEPATARTEKSILVAGIIDRNKAYDIILEAFARVAAGFPDWKLVFAGNGAIDDARRIAGKLGIGHRVDFPGWVSGERKSELFAHADVYCLASFKEGFPVVVLEAWAWRLPVICTPAGGLVDVVVDGENALVVEPGNANQLAAAMAKMMADPALRLKLADNSHRLVNKRFTMPVIYRRLEKIYLKLGG